MSSPPPLVLEINAKPAAAGAAKFVGALNSIKSALKGLERDSNGAFTSLKKGMQLKIGGAPEKAINRTSDAALRLSTNVKNSMVSAANSTQNLVSQLKSIGDTSGIQRAESALASFTAKAKSASSAANLGSVKADYRASIAGLKAESTAQVAASKASALHAKSLVDLKTKFVPIFAVSQKYEQQLNELNTAQRLGVVTSSQYDSALENLNNQLALGVVSSNKWGQSVRVSSAHMSAASANVLAQFNDIGVMLASGQSPLILAMQQGTQLSQVLNQMAGRKGGGVLAVLKSGFLAMLNPISLITIGTIAAGAALFQFAQKAFSAEEETEKLTEKVSKLNQAVDSLASNTTASAGQIAAHLKTAFGSVSSDVQALIDDLRQAEFSVISNKIQKEVESASKQMTRLGGAYSVFWAEMENPNSVEAGYLKITQDVISSAKMTYVEFTRLDKALKAVFQAKNVDDFIGGLSQARAIADEIGGPIGGAIKDALTAAAQESGVLNRVLADSNGQTTAWADNMSRVAVQVSLIKSSLSSIAGGILGNASKAVELKALKSGASAKNAAIQAKTFQKNAGWAGRSVGANIFEQGLIASEKATYDLGLKLDAQLDKARKSAQSLTRSSGGGGAGSGAQIETDIQKYKALTKLVLDTTDALQIEEAALRMLTAGQFENAEAAQMMAKAMAYGGGAVDQQTKSMIDQAEAAITLNKQLKMLANDPIKDWKKSAQDWVQTSQTVEKDAVKSLSDSITNFVTTGKMDFRSLASSIIASLTRVLVDKSIADFMDMFSGGKSGGGKSWVGTAISMLFGAGSEGGISGSLPATQSMPISAFKGAPQYSEGTANTSNGIPSILHPNEAVVPLSRGRKIPVDIGGARGGNTFGDIVTTVNVETGDGETDAETALKIAAAVEETIVGIVETKMAEGMMYGGAMNPRGGM